MISVWSEFFFKTLPNQQIVFYRWGLIGQGIEIPSQSVQRKLQVALILYLWLLLIGITWLSIQFTYLHAYGMLFIWCMLYTVTTAWLMRQLPICPVRMTLEDSLARRARQLPYWALYTGFSLSLIALFITTLNLLTEREQILLHVVLMGFFSLLSYAYRQLVVYKNHLPSPPT